MDYSEWYEIHWVKPTYYTRPDGSRTPWNDSGVIKCENGEDQEETMKEARRMHAKGEYSNIVVFRQSIITLASFSRATTSQK